MTLSASASKGPEAASGRQVKGPEAARAAQQATGQNAQPSPPERQVGVAAARLRVTLDRRLNRETPAGIIALAQEEL